MLDKKQIETDLKEVFARCVKKNEPAIRRIKKFFEESCRQSGEAPVQQLQAEIDSCIPELEIAFNDGDEDRYERVLNKLRQLSAVQ